LAKDPVTLPIEEISGITLIELGYWGNDAVPGIRELPAPLL
jgi:hypothetical protein